jgi:hypothetical protein
MAPRPFRNREDASDLVAALMSTTGARYATKYLECPAMSAGSMEKSSRCTVPPIAFIEKSEARAREFGLFDLKTGYVVANRGGLCRPTDRKSAGQIELTPFSHAVIICCRERHGPS